MNLYLLCTYTHTRRRQVGQMRGKRHDIPETRDRGIIPEEEGGGKPPCPVRHTTLQAAVIAVIDSVFVLAWSQPRWVSEHFTSHEYILAFALQLGLTLRWKNYCTQ